MQTPIKMFYRFFTFIFVSFLSSVAVAQGIHGEFLKKGSEIPLALERLGYTQFGKLNLNNFLNALPAHQVTFSDHVDKLNRNGRISGHWDAAGNISVYSKWWKRFRDQQSVLALHEYLGAEGYSDDQYWLSVSMWFLALPETQANLSKTIRTRIAQWITMNANLRIPKGTQMAGGVVGVGGGGESGTLYIKMHGLLDSVRALGKPLEQNERNYNIGMISHYLSSSTTVTWGNRGLK